MTAEAPAPQDPPPIDFPVIAFWVGDEDDLHRQLGRLVMEFATVDDWMTQILAALIVHADHGHDMTEVHAALLGDRNFRFLDDRANEIEKRMMTQHHGTRLQVPADVLHQFRGWRSAVRMAHDRRNRIIHDAWAFTSGPEILLQVRPPGSGVPAHLDLNAEANNYAELARRGRNLMWAFRHVVFPTPPHGA